MINVQKAALYFGALNLLIGLAGFFGPFVTGNRDGLINIETGHLFGLMAINWAHALVFLAFGVYGLAAHGAAESATTYFWAVAVIFGLPALLGLLAHAGWMRVTEPGGTPVVFEIAIDWAGTALHLLWAALGAFFALRAHSQMNQNEHQPAHA
jgi:hypothetical protein